MDNLRRFVMVPLRALVSLLFFFFNHLKMVLHQCFFLSWASRPTELLCLTQKSNNLDQQKNLEDQPAQEQC